MDSIIVFSLKLTLNNVFTLSIALASYLYKCYNESTIYGVTVRSCKYCDVKLTHHAAKICDSCFKAHIIAYGKEYREKNKEFCQIRSKRSYLKRPEHYLKKRKENYRRKHGIPLDDPFVKRKAGEGNIDAQGYKTITKRGHPNQMDDKGRIREHVYVMSENLKRPLKKGESVHHKNGDRLDNRIENLELWTKGQPAGGRVADKIKWCIEFLSEYGYNVSHPLNSCP